jgi:hypothetical protein
MDTIRSLEWVEVIDLAFLRRLLPKIQYSRTMLKGLKVLLVFLPFFYFSLSNFPYRRRQFLNYIRIDHFLITTR